MNTDETLVELDRSLAIPYLDQWFGYWLMEPERGAKLLRFVQSLNLSMHLQQVTVNADGQRPTEADRNPKPAPPRSERWSTALTADAREVVRVRNGYDYEIIDGVAMADLTGKLMKQAASGGGTSTVMMRQSVRAMQRDDRVKAVIFLIDSPGGTVAGAFDLAADIAALSSRKPTYAFIEDLGASAAYLQAAQMRSISANSTAAVGSIGTFAVVYDSSAAAAMEGVGVHVIAGRIGGKPAPMKGAGAPGTKITPDQLARWQEEVDDLNEQFLASVMKGRRMDRKQVEGVADGGVWVASKALERRLIDRVESLDAMFNRVRVEVAGQKPAAGARADHAAPQAATHAVTIKDGDREITYRADSVEGVMQLQQALAETPPADPNPQNNQAEAADGNVPAGAGAEAATAEINPPQTGADMSQPNTPAPDAKAQEPQGGEKPATMADLKAACPGASSDFLVEASEKGMTLPQAKDAFLHWQAAQIRQRDEDLKKAQENRQDEPPKAPGNKAIPSGKPGAAAAGAAGDESAASAEFDQRVSERMQNRGESRHVAAANVLASDDDLRERYTAEQNEARKDRIIARRQAIAASVR